ncbi:MAG: hypothetical protein P1Q69_21520, partial [Candidatus Thorarchaeota archaeon]|nr:hypothetical protein [Candidatus Thorarchaeota archaeon]
MGEEQLSKEDEYYEFLDERDATIDAMVEEALDEYEPEYGESNSSGCSFGCTYRKSGCDIKGNISIETSEKIYHVP